MSNFDQSEVWIIIAPKMAEQADDANISENGYGFRMIADKNSGHTSE